MTTITIKVNERTKAGKAFLAMTETFLKDSKGIEIIENDKSQKNHYNPKFLTKIKRAEENIKKGKTTRLNTNDIWGSIL